MTREEILSAISARLSYDLDLRERTMSSIQGTLDELDALPPFPQESEFQSQLSRLIYPFLAAVQAMDTDQLESAGIVSLAHDMFMQAAREASGQPGSSPTPRL